MRFLHSMIRVRDIEESLYFFCALLGLEEVRRRDSETGRYTLIFLKAPGDAQEYIELTFNWDNSETYSNGRNFGHLAFEVDDIYQICQRLQQEDVAINRPPRDGRMAFIKSPDGISIELLQRGNPRSAQEPWASMENQGSW